MQKKWLKSILHFESFILDDTHTHPLGTEDFKLLIISGDIASQAIFGASNKYSLVRLISRFLDFQVKELPQVLD